MIKVTSFEDAPSILNTADKQVMESGRLYGYLTKQCTASFEAYAAFDICSFDWYDLQDSENETYRILIYYDREDLLIFCENSSTAAVMQKLADGDSGSNEIALYKYFTALLKEDMEYIDSFEEKITDAEDGALTGSRKDYLNNIVEYRKELLRLKRYYTQLQMIFDGMADNENGLFSDDAVRHFNVLNNRVTRCYAAVLNLRDYVTQMREAYQAQIDIEQNALMKFFTLITALFLPLTLMVGWYGMNFRNMPEILFPWGYPVFILASLLVIVLLIVYFKKKKWL